MTLHTNDSSEGSVERSNFELNEARDLRRTLIVGLLTTLVFGFMILASESGTGLLLFPTLETSLLVLASILVTAVGLVLLQTGTRVRSVAWGALIAYTAIITLVVHYTGGPQTPVPSLYLLVVVAASFLLGGRGVGLIATLSVIGYAVVLLLEYFGVLDMVLIWRQDFNPRESGPLLIGINWLALAIPILFTAQLSGALAGRLKATNAELRESERMREQLTQLIVHDLRNPLTALIGSLEVLNLTLVRQASEEQRNLLDSARRSAHVLAKLVDELLDVSKMEVGMLALKPEPVDLAELIRTGVESVQAQATLQGLEVCAERVEDVESVVCDQQMIDRVLANLLANAIDYSPSGSRVTVTATQEEDYITVSVNDTGSGIPLEHQARIFEKFAAVEHPDQKRRGTGLGLTFCKMAVEAHGGRIWVESHPDEGSTFSFTLPVTGAGQEMVPLAQGDNV